MKTPRLRALAIQALASASAFALPAGAPEEDGHLPASASRSGSATETESTSAFGDRGSRERREGWEHTPEQDAAIREGLTWLAEHQGRSGAWAADGPYVVAITALAGLAFLAHGEVPDQGPYGRNVRQAIQFVLDSQQPDGVFQSDETAGLHDARPMHGHGYALLFLAEAWGEGGDADMRRRIALAVRRGAELSARSQTGEGGWFYTPNPRDSDEGSVTVTQIQALRSARNAGIHVEPTAVERAVDYISRSQVSDGGAEDGGIRYTLREQGNVSPALTAAGMSVLHGAGAYSSASLDRGFLYLARNLDVDDTRHFFHYAHLYAVQAYHQRGGTEWRSYFPRVRAKLLELRGDAPSWESDFGAAYGTACALLVLELPYRYLPIFER